VLAALYTHIRLLVYACTAGIFYAFEVYRQINGLLIETGECSKVLFDLRPNEDYANDHIVQNPIDSGTQAQRDVSGHEVNTTIIEHINRGMVHTEVSTRVPKAYRCRILVRKLACLHLTLLSPRQVAAAPEELFST
jgi:hypothetical protein